MAAKLSVPKNKLCHYYEAVITIGKEFIPYYHIFQVKIPEDINLISLATDDLAS